jgi:hypothetical protein
MPAHLVPKEAIARLAAEVDSPAALLVLRHLRREGYVMNGKDVSPPTEPSSSASRNWEWSIRVRRGGDGKASHVGRQRERGASPAVHRGLRGGERTRPPGTRTGASACSGGLSSGHSSSR